MVRTVTYRTIVIPNQGTALVRQQLYDRPCTIYAIMHTAYADATYTMSLFDGFSVGATLLWYEDFTALISQTDMRMTVQNGLFMEMGNATATTGTLIIVLEIEEIQEGNIHRDAQISPRNALPLIAFPPPGQG